MGRATLLVVLGASVVLGTMNLQINQRSEQAMENMVSYFERTLARDLANQAAEYLLTQLADSSSWRVPTLTRLPVDLVDVADAHSAYFSIRDTTLRTNGENRSAIKLVVEATYGRQMHTVVVLADSLFGIVPPTVRGAFTANGPLDQTISDMQIDGRDHDENGNLIRNSGVFGVSSGTVFTNTQNAQIGGTDGAGIDRPMSYPEDPRIIEQNYPWGGAFPDNPDKVLGLPEGTLKTIAQSGEAGSQYVTDPKYLRFPLRGITYVELPAGVSWKGAKLGSDPSGVLIVHNTSVNARVENISTSNNTPFRGLVIADYMFHLHLDVLGAILLLSPNLERVKECKGNQDHKVFYSQKTIKQATQLIVKKGSGWKGRVPIIGWRE
ncbi:MAG TPA: hypothetical protein VNL36_00850 [Bacteroidota bacterium]|nr:hypothetical protein [Bacteroidota bacterium]